MTGDGVPSEEQLRRIEHGVMQRIEARRRAVRSVAGGVTALVLVAGGFALLPRIGFSGGASTSGSAGGSSAEDGAAASAAAAVEVLCHTSGARDSTARAVEVDPAGLPRSAALACARVAFQSSDQRMPSRVPQAASPAPPATVCRDRHAVHVYPAVVDCAEIGMADVRR